MFGGAPFGAAALGGVGGPATQAGPAEPVTVVANCLQTFAILGAALVTVSANFPQTFAILGAAPVTVSANFAQTFAILGISPAGGGNLAKVPAYRIVPFEASGHRVTIFGSSGPRVEFDTMSAKAAYLAGNKWMADRDPDEESRHAADITEELAARNTTAVESELELLLAGVIQLEEPTIETAVINGVTRTFVVAFLGGTEVAPPTDGTWAWTARVRCANGERFDKTTYFNRVDT